MTSLGVPEEIVSGNRPQFSLEKFHKFSQEYAFKHFSASPYYPQANGEEESGVCIAKKILRQRDPFLVLTCMSYRAATHTQYLHWCKSFPVNDGKRNLHPSTYIGIELKAGSTKPRSSCQKG